jgi:hypothetical protein
MADVIHSWRFPSSSNPNKIYQTLKYADGSTSCDCKGWTMKRYGQERGCRHTAAVHAGTADRECIPGTSLDMVNGINTTTRVPIRQIGNASSTKAFKALQKEREKIPARKISWK